MEEPGSDKRGVGQDPGGRMKWPFTKPDAPRRVLKSIPPCPPYAGRYPAVGRLREMQWKIRNGRGVEVALTDLYEALIDAVVELDSED